MNKPPRIGELLIHAGVINAEQLERALAEQKRWGRRLGMTLIKLGMIDENHLVRTLAQQIGLPATSLVGRRIAPEVIALVPAKVAELHNVVPLFVSRMSGVGKLFLGMEDPSKLEVLDDVSFRSGLEIQPVMMGPTELGEAIDRYYRRQTVAVDGVTEPSGETTISERSLGLASPRVAGRNSTERPPVSPLPTTTTPDELPVIELAQPIEVEGPEPGFALPPLGQRPLDSVPTDDSDGLVADAAPLVRPTDDAVLAFKAITQLLVEKGILGQEEIQSRIARLQSGGSKG